MKRNAILTACLIATVALAAVLFAQTTHPRRDWHRGPGGLMQHITRTFNLTDAQQAQIKALWEAEKPNVVPLLQQLSESHKQMLAATQNGAFDEAKVTSIATQQSQTITQLLVEKEKLSSKFYQLLTPEQRSKFDSLRQQRENHMDQLLQRLATDGAVPPAQ